MVVLDEATGALTTTKTPSTPADHSAGFLTGAEKGLAAAGASWPGVASVFHGTTVATNALLQGEVTGLGFLTTAGFRHLLEIGRQSVPDGYGNSYFWVKPDRIVPLHLVREVPERVDATGEVLRPLDEDAVVAQARWFRDRGVTAVGVCLLHAYVNPAHELRVRDLFGDAYPACSVSISSDVLREYREYERSVTTLVDAFVKPSVARYVERLAAELAERAGQGVPFFVMKSNGGVTSADQVARKPITTVLSGPAAGALGAAAVTHAAGFDDVVTLDGGGTSTDVAVIRSGAPSLTTEATVGRFPAKVPMIDIVTVGAGGGSVAWVSPEGTLKVGPRSAGADPGPLCYGRGGTEPTLTDAALVLGRIPPTCSPARSRSTRGAAQSGIDALAGELGSPPRHAPRGSSRSGHGARPTPFARSPSAGGSTFATWRCAPSGAPVRCRLLGCSTCWGSPPRSSRPTPATSAPSACSRSTSASTTSAPSSPSTPSSISAALADVYRELEGEAASALAAEGFDVADQRFLRSADLRYDGQAFEVRVELPGGPIDAGWAADVLRRFHDEHERLYGYCYRNQPHHGVEWVNVRLAGIGPLEAPAIAPVRAGNGKVATTGVRPVFFDGSWHETPVVWRGDLGAGDELRGPAVVEEYGSTLPVPPGRARRGRPPRCPGRPAVARPGGISPRRVAWVACPRRRTTPARSRQR